jgi:Uma2 family endonuclease
MLLLTKKECPRFTFITDADQVQVPGWVVDLESFRRWADSDEFPESGRICYLKGEVWVDMSKEQIHSHNQVKAEFTIVVGGMVKKERSGHFYPDGLRLTNVSADISGVPDGTYVSAKSRRAGKVQLVQGKEEGYVEIEGTPDMVLEILSASSVQKDTEILFQAYWEASIPEYWLVDARKKPLRFDIYRRTSKGYVATRKVGGWIKSKVFGKEFKLTQGTDEFGDPEYSLSVR